MRTSIAVLLFSLPAYAQSGAGAPPSQSATEFRIAALEAKVAEQAVEIEALKRALEQLEERVLPLKAAPVPAPAGTSLEPPRSPSDPVRRGSDVIAGNCISCPKPVFPAAARLARVTDTVILSVTIGNDGLVKDARVIRGHTLLQQAALDAVKKWRYQPIMLNGEAVEVTKTVSISFVFE